MTRGGERAGFRPEGPAQAGRPGSYAFRFGANALLVLLLVKLALALWGTSGSTLAWNLASYFQDAALVLAGGGCLTLAGRFGPRALYRLGQVLYLLLISFVTAASIAYTPLIPDILRDPVNIFSLDWAIIPFSVEYCFRPSWLLLVLAFFGALIGVSFFFPRRVRPSSLPVVLLVLLHGALFLASLFRPVVSPIVYSVADESLAVARRVHNRYGITRLKTAAQPNADARFGLLYRETEGPLAVAPRYRRVVVLVMESVTYTDFTAHFASPASPFWEKVKDHAVLHTNYHGVDLESYTGLIAMLNSVLVPYRAYVDDSPFRFVNARGNLVRSLKESGFTTCFASSYGPQQVRFVPDPADWDAILLKDLDKPKGFVRVDANKMESGLEDNAVLEDVVGLCRSHPRLFLYQEMVCGHVASWEERTGVEPLAYYDHYFTKLYERLQEEGLLDGTLFAITSDHGLRAAPSEASSYHLPLLFIASDLAPGQDGAFLSHLDFAGLLRSRLGERRAQPEVSYLLTVGSTVAFVYGNLTSDGGYAFIDDHSLRVHTNEAAADVRDCQLAFEAYRAFFDSERRKAPSGNEVPRRDNLVLK